MIPAQYWLRLMRFTKVTYSVGVKRSSLLASAANMDILQRLRAVRGMSGLFVPGAVVVTGTVVVPGATVDPGGVVPGGIDSGRVLPGAMVEPGGVVPGDIDPGVPGAMVPTGPVVVRGVSLPLLSELV